MEDGIIKMHGGEDFKVDSAVKKGEKTAKARAAQVSKKRKHEEEDKEQKSLIASLTKQLKIEQRKNDSATDNEEIDVSAVQIKTAFGPSKVKTLKKTLTGGLTTKHGRAQAAFKVQKTATTVEDDGEWHYMEDEDVTSDMELSDDLE